jgi:hypothetical protein
MNIEFYSSDVYLQLHQILSVFKESVNLQSTESTNNTRFRKVRHLIAIEPRIRDGDVAFNGCLIHENEALYYSIEMLYSQSDVLFGSVY